MRLLFVARALNGMAGGVERMVIALANEMQERGHDVGLFTWDRADAQAFYPISPVVLWSKLDLGDADRKASLFTRLRRIFSVRRIVREFEPDVVVAFQVGAFRAVRVYCSGMRIPMIATERNSPTLYDHIGEGDEGRRKSFDTFRLASSLVVQCESYVPMHPEFLQSKLVVIPNPVYPADGQADLIAPGTSGRFRLLSVGRLSYQKNFESLIEAFSQVAPNFPLWDLVIVGEGEDRLILEQLVAEKRLEERVALPGTTTAPDKYYKSSHLFCLPSRWEGFPNALAEALAHGLAAVGFEEAGGVNDLVENEVNGLLAEGNGSSDSLAAALAILMEDAPRRQLMGAEAVASIARYAPERVMDRWESLFRETTSLER